MAKLLNPPMQLLVLAAAFLAALSPAGQALGQRGVGSDEVDRSLRRAGTTVKRWVAKPNSDQTKVKLFEDYFDKYYFPSMTQTTPEALGDVGKLRSDLFRGYIDVATPALRRQLTERSLEFATRVIRRRAADGSPRRYHRATEYNALLILGDLTSDGTKPLPEATDFLCQVSSLASQKKLASYMQAGALVGLSRPASVLDQAPQAQQQKVFEALTNATQAESISEGASADVRDWLRRSAAISLATAAKKVSNPQAVTTLVSLVADDSLGLGARTQIAASLKGLEIPAGSGAAEAVLNLAQEVAKYEADEAAEFEDMQIGVGRSSRMGSPIQSKRFRIEPEDQRTVYIREPLIARLTHLRDGLRATASSAGDLAASVNSAISAASSVIELASAEGADKKVDLDITRAVAGLAKELTRLAPAPAPAEEHAEDAPAEGVDEAVSELL